MDYAGGDIGRAAEWQHSSGSAVRSPIVAALLLQTLYKAVAAIQDVTAYVSKATSAHRSSAPHLEDEAESLLFALTRLLIGFVTRDRPIWEAQCKSYCLR
jgi:hypothetical protein